MKKLPLILTLLFLAITFGGYFLYDTLLRKKTIDLWSLVPESSVVVYESGSCIECKDSLLNSSISKIIQTVSFDSRKSGSAKSIIKFLTASHFDLVSLHVTKKDDFDFVYYSKADQKSFSVIEDQWVKEKDIKISEHEFNSVRIKEAKCGDQTFSWFTIDNIWTGSFTPFLIEDVVRTYESGEELNFKKKVIDVYQLPRNKDDSDNLYVNLLNFSDWLKTFADNESNPFISLLGKSSVLDIKTTANNFSLNGFSSDSSSRAGFALSIFSNQNPVPFNSKRLISNRTVMLTSYGISDGESFKNNLLTFHGRKAELNDTLSKISKSLNFKSDDLYKTIKGEALVCYVESKGQNISKVMLVETAKPDPWVDALNSLSSKLSIDTVFFEKFSDYEIRELPLFRFPEKMFWPLVSGFDRSYYTVIDNTVIFAEDLEELKKFLQDIDEEETWGKSVNQNKYLGSTLLESSISLYVNTPRVLNVLTGVVNPRWKKFMMDNRQVLQVLGMGSIQFSHQGEDFYTNVFWDCKYLKSVSQQKLDRKVITNLGSAISKVFVFKNHVDKRDEALVIDSANNLELISLEGKVLWSVSLPEPIQGTVEQVDYFNNGKLQFLFSTATKLYLVDRLGNDVSPFPISLPSNDNEFMNVIDYDHSRKYRFLVAGKSGKLWMYDKDGKNLEGWKPNNLGEALVMAPQHHRIRGKDYILAFAKNGKVFVMNRRGESIKKFPLNLNAKLSGDYFLEPGKDISLTYFILVSRDGFRIKFNLEGIVQSKETLVKTSPTDLFSLVKERNGKSYLIMRQDSKQLVLMDETGKTIISNDFVGHDPVKVDYVDFGAGNIFISITDTRQELSFVYDGNGNLLTTPPLESTMVVPRIVDEKIVLFSGYEKALHILPQP